MRNRDRTLEKIDQLKAFRGIGETFDFMGRRLIVMGHYERLPIGHAFPCLKCAYVDDTGRIRRISFSNLELPALVDDPNA